MEVVTLAEGGLNPATANFFQRNIKIMQMDLEETKELLKIFNTLLEKASDKNGCLTELARGRCDIMRQFQGCSFNPDGKDTNGMQSHYKAMKEQADKIDELILALAKA